MDETAVSVVCTGGIVVATATVVEGVGVEISSVEEVLASVIVTAVVADLVMMQIVVVCVACASAEQMMVAAVVRMEV